MECSASLTREHQYRSFFNVSLRTKSHHGYSKTLLFCFLSLIEPSSTNDHSDANDAAFNRSNISLCGDGYDNGKLAIRDVTTDQILVKDLKYN